MKEKAGRSRYCFVVLHSGLSDPGQINVKVQNILVFSLETFSDPRTPFFSARKHY